MKHFLERKIIIVLLVFSMSTLITTISYSQSKDVLGIARTLMSLGKVDSAIAAYQYAYQDEPYNMKIYEEYLGVLTKEKKYDKAIELIDYMAQVKRDDVGIVMDKVAIYIAQGEQRKARKLVEEMVNNTVNKSEYDIRKAVGILEEKKHYKEAIAILEQKEDKTDPMLRNPNMPDNTLARLYLLDGALDKALPIYMQQVSYDQSIEADFRAKLLTLIEKDKTVTDKVKKELNKLVKDSNVPSTAIAQTLAWLDQLSGKHVDAIETLINIDKKSVGSQEADLIRLASVASYEGQYADAMKAYGYLVTTMDSTHRNKQAIEYEYLRNAIFEIHRKRPVDMNLVANTVQHMQSFFTTYPERKVDALFLSYTDIIAKQQMIPDKAIALVQEVLDSMRPSKDYIGYGKIALGDYHLFQGEVWDANLYYAQVDKLFRQDKIGEEARFKQAKVAYYRGDFEWAQQSLNILKASTTENISNDAMQLSIVITENTADDTASLPLKAFAKADLMIYQQQYDSAKVILEQLLQDFPDHALVDDVLMLKAKIARDEGDLATAIASYQIVLDKYKDDVLADDAMLQMAHLYYKQLKDKDKAKTYYENIVIDYPQSTLVATARAMLKQIEQAHLEPNAKP